MADYYNFGGILGQIERGKTVRKFSNILGRSSTKGLTEFQLNLAQVGMPAGFTQPGSILGRPNTSVWLTDLDWMQRWGRTVTSRIRGVVLGVPAEPGSFRGQSLFPPVRGNFWRFGG